MHVDAQVCGRGVPCNTNTVAGAFRRRMCTGRGMQVTCGCGFMGRSLMLHQVLMMLVRVLCLLRGLCNNIKLH